MTIRDQIKREGGPAAFARLTDIPYRTVQSWWREGHADGRTPPAWLAPILEDALRWRKDNTGLSGGGSRPVHGLVGDSIRED